MKTFAIRAGRASRLPTAILSTHFVVSGGELTQPNDQA